MDYFRCTNINFIIWRFNSSIITKIVSQNNKNINSFSLGFEESFIIDELERCKFLRFVKQNTTN